MVRSKMQSRKCIRRYWTFKGDEKLRGIKIFDAYLASSHSSDCSCTSWDSITYAANMRERASRLAAGEKSSDPSTSFKFSHFSGKSVVRKKDVLRRRNHYLATGRQREPCRGAPVAE
jgi:hypothetical protein